MAKVGFQYFNNATDWTLNTYMGFFVSEKTVMTDRRQCGATWKINAFSMARMHAACNGQSGVGQWRRCFAWTGFCIFTSSVLKKVITSFEPRQHHRFKSYWKRLHDALLDNCVF